VKELRIGVEGKESKVKRRRRRNQIYLNVLCQLYFDSRQISSVCARGRTKGDERKGKNWIVIGRS